jgi:hypothetical protein
MAVERRFRIHFGPIYWPAALFLCFVTYGLAYGLVRGGNTVIALWEARSIYYMLAMLLLVANLIETRAQLSRLIWIIAIVLFLKGIAGVMYVANVLQWDRTGVERIAEHSMSIHFNLLFVLVAAVWMYHDSTLRRLILPTSAAPGSSPSPSRARSCCCCSTARTASSSGSSPRRAW